MDHKTRAELIAEMLLEVEDLSGVELLEAKLRVKDKEGNVTALVHFNPVVWRDANEPMKVMIEPITEDGIQPAKFYRA